MRSKDGDNSWNIWHLLVTRQNVDLFHPKNLTKIQKIVFLESNYINYINGDTKIILKFMTHIQSETRN
jgi:hypothetical protein